MSLPPPKIRKLLHTRSVTFRGYQRDDGLWDIEANIIDAKTYDLKRPDRSTLLAGMPVHDMAVRVTVDDSLTIREIVTSMSSKPFPECIQAQDPMQKMIGSTMGPGWRNAVDKNLGGIRGCTHLRELLFNMATAAVQTVPSYREHLRRLAGQPTPSTGQPPFHLGTCMSWDFNGPVVERYFPEYFGRQPSEDGRETRVASTLTRK